jgi:hypothetical protein
MSQPVPSGYTVLPWASLPAYFTLTALTGGKWWGYSGTTLYLDTTNTIINLYADQPSDVFGGTGATGWMRLQRLGTSGGVECPRHSGFDMYLLGYTANNQDCVWKFYYVTGGPTNQVIVGNNYPNNGVGYYVQDSGNGRVRINSTNYATATMFVVSNMLPGGGIYDGTYISTSPYITNTNGAWHSVLVNRLRVPGKTMTHIGHPDVSVNLANRSFYGYMSEIILIGPSLTVTNSNVNDYDIFYKNAHVPFWQNGLIASYTPENWTGTSWLNGNFGTLPVTTLTGTTTVGSATNYQNIFTNLTSGAQTSARAIFSYRRVNMNYVGPTFRLRRSSDNVLLTFYANGAGNLGTDIGATGTPLIEWLGGATAYVDTWYDQSNQMRHATQFTWTLQPILNTSKQIIDFTGSTYMNLPNGTIPMQTTFTFVVRHGYIGTTTGGFIGGGNNTNNQGNNLGSTTSGQGYSSSFVSSDVGANLGTTPVQESVVTCRYDGPTTSGSTYFFVNGVQTNSGARSGWAGVAGNEVIGKTAAVAVVAGFSFIIYAGYFADNPTYTNTVLYTGTTTSTSTLNNSTNSQYSGGRSVVWVGYYTAPSSGTYAFRTSSDDASYLWVGITSGWTAGNSTVNNGGLHGTNTVTGNATLTGGTTYYIRMIFGDNGGGYDFNAFVTPPGGSLTDLGSLVFDYSGASNFNGYMYDCFIFASALSDADRTSIENTILNSSSALPFLYGPSGASITWPTGVLPSTYSMFHLAKYQKPNKGTYGRILQGTTSNWLSGFWTQLSGVAYHGSWFTQNSLSAHGTNWVLSTDQNNLYRSLGRTRGTTTGAAADTLAINAGFTPSETADFAFQALMVYNRTLSASEYRMVEDYMANRFKIPVPPQEGLALSLDASDYFTTNGTTWYDRSPNANNFTLSATGAYVSTGAFPYMALSANRATIATAVPVATYNTLIVFGTIKNSTGNWRGLIARDGNLMQVFIENGSNRLGMYNSNGGFIPCDQNVDVSTLDQVYTRFNMHVWKLSSVSPYYQYYFNPSVAPCTPTGIITDFRASYTAGFAFLSDSDAVSARYWGDMATVLYYTRDLSDEELVETYRRHMTKYLLPTPFIPFSPKPTGYVFTRSGMYTPGTGVTYVKVLVIAGGAGGGGGFEGGGGGAGGLVYSAFYYVTAGTPIQVIIGEGGRGARRNSLPGNGGNTIFGTLTAYGGGAGGSDQNTSSIGPASVDGRSGGSGGGGTWGSTSSSVLNPGSGYTGQGFAGGIGYGNPYVGGGGGGAVSRGFDGASYIAGNGGTGATYTLLGVTKSYCGGGGGSLRGSGTSSGGLGGGGGGNGAGRGANATYYGSGGGAGGGNGTVCHGGDGFQGIVILEINTDPFSVPVLQNPGNQAFVAGGNFIINQLSQGIPELRWTISLFYNQPVLTTPFNQNFGSTPGTFTVTQTVNAFLVGPLVWTISPSTGVTLQSNSSSSATFFVSGTLAAVPTTVTVTGPDGKTATTGTFTITCTPPQGLLAAMTTTAKNSANGLFGLKALLSYSATILTVRRASDNATVNVISDPTGNYTVSTGGTYATWIGASTGYVTQWWDQSGKNAHATQATTGSQPIFNTTNKYIDFKTTAWFSMPNGTIPYVNTNYTVVTKINTIANAQACLWGSGGYGTVRAVNALERGGGGSYAQYWWGDDCAGPAAATGNVVTSKYDNTVGRTIYVNGSSAGTNTSLLRNSTNVNNTIACDWRNNAAGVFLNGELYYLQIYSTVLSDADRGIAETISVT